MRLIDLTYDVVRHRFLIELNRESTPKNHMVAAAYLLANRQETTISLRAILKTAGYAASKFYRYWPARSHFLLEAYLICVERFIDSEVSLAREFTGTCPREFFEFVAKHTVLSQKHIHRDFFREIAGSLAGGDYSKLLVHMDSQVRRNTEIFIEKFPEYRFSMRQKAGQPLIWAVGTFILIRNYDRGLDVVDDDCLIALIADAYSGLFVNGIPARQI